MSRENLRSLVRSRHAFIEYKIEVTCCVGVDICVDEACGEAGFDKKKKEKKETISLPPTHY